MVLKYIQTFRVLLNRPRHVVDGHIYSDENRYQHPFLFCIIGTVVFLVLNLFIIDFSFEPATPVVDSENEQIQELAIWMDVAAIRASTQFLPLSMLLLLIPMLSLPGLFFLREELKSFYSNLVLNCYTTGMAMTAFLALIPLWLLLDIPFTDPFMNTTLPAVFIGGMGLWVYKNYFRPAGFVGWIRIFSSFISGYILFIFVKNFAAGIIGYMLFAINRIMELSAG